LTEEDGWTHPGNKEYKDWTDADVDWIQGEAYKNGQKTGARVVRTQVEDFVRTELGKKLSITTDFTLTDKDYKEVLVALVTTLAKENEKR
jgi:hypothetical protein